MALKVNYKFNNNLDDEVSPLNLLSLSSGPVVFSDGAVQGFTASNFLASNTRLLTDFIPNTSYTIEMWIKFVTGPDNQEVFGIYAGGQIAFSVKITTFGTPDTYLQLIALNNGFSAHDITNYLDDDLFHHLAVVSNGTHFNSYFDGVAMPAGSQNPSFQTYHLPTSYPGYSGRIFVGSNSFAGAVDDIKIHDTPVYIANFTPVDRSGGAIVLPTDKIKAKVTVGGKLILSLNSSPITDGGTVAPIGSQALVNISGVGSTWIKSGPGDVDWLRIATGIVEDGWNMVYNVNDLDAPVADAFFGSNATAFDGKITFVRRGTSIMEFLTNNKISILKEIVMTEASAVISFDNTLTIGDTTSSKAINLVSSNITLNSGLSGRVLEYYSGSHRRYKAGKTSPWFQPTLADLIVPLAIENAGQLFSKEAILNIRLIMKKVSDNSNVSMVRKTIALESSGAVMSFGLVQDEFTYINPAVAGLNIRLEAGAVFGTINVIFSGYADVANYQCVVMLDVEAFES